MSSCVKLITLIGEPLYLDLLNPQVELADSKENSRSLSIDYHATLESQRFSAQL